MYFFRHAELNMIKKYANNTLILLGFCYLIFHIIHGERGLLALFRKQKELSISRALLSDLENKKIFLERRISLLGKKIDLDMLEERVRIQLNYVKPTEKVIFED